MGKNNESPYIFLYVAVHSKISERIFRKAGIINGIF